MRAWIRRTLHVHRWRTSPAQRAMDLGMGQEMVRGTVRQCRKCFLCDWATFQPGSVARFARGLAESLDKERHRQP